MQSYQQIPVKVKCPVCNTNDAHRLWSISSKQAAQHFVLKEKHPKIFLELVSHIESLWGQNTCEIVQCDRCEFCYSNPYIAGDKRYYDLTQINPYFFPWKWEFQQTYDVLNKYSRSNVKLLDIGAGDGTFVKRIAENILPKENITCVEFSESGTHQIEKLGVKCLSEDIRSLSNPELEESFDIVCMFQVLEHADNLSALFKKLGWLMKKGGSLFIGVPSERILRFNELNGGLLDMPPQHIGRWNIKCFKEIGKQNGFHVVDYKTEDFRFGLMLKDFLKHRFVKKSQYSGSFENQILKIKNWRLLRIMMLISKAVDSITAIPIFIIRNPRVGNCQWIHLKKSKN